MGMLAAAAGLAAALSAGTAQAEGKGRVAVRNFAAKGVDPSIASTLETSFCTALADHYEALCPDEIKALMATRQQQLGLGGCDNEEECLKAISTVSNAPKVVTGEVGKLGVKYILSVTLLEAETNKVLARGTESTEKVEDLLDKVVVLAKKLAGK